jgi:drug/metabolite transporter (DMT)-like permease
VLGERVTWRRWAGVLCGFAGVALMVRPGTALFDWAALLPILCGAAYAVSMILARTMGRQDSAAAMAFWGNIAFLICAAALSAWFGPGAHVGAAHPSLAFLTRGWAMPTPTDALLMCTCGLIAAVGLTLLTQAYAMARAAVVAPFEFTFAFWGLLWGWLIFGTLPDALGWLGIAVIVASGLYVIHREGIEAGEPGAAPQPS